MIQTLGDFDRAWSLILEFIQNAALSKNGEVSLAALKSLQEIMYHNSESNCLSKVETNSASRATSKDDEIWNVIILKFMLASCQSIFQIYLPIFVDRLEDLVKYWNGEY